MSLEDLPLIVNSNTHIGLVHHTNEDSHTVLTPGDGALVMVVCDGMGGMGRGDEASKLAISTLTEELNTLGGEPSHRMLSALRQADKSVRESLCTERSMPGSTAVMAWVAETGRAHVAWVGDSRCYWIRNGSVLDRTIDHKLVEELVKNGILTREEAKSSPQSHVVTRALGGRPPSDTVITPEALLHPWLLRNGDAILLCSDGLCDLVEDDEIASIVSTHGVDEALQRLQDLALERGGHDNITIILSKWTGADFEEDDAPTPMISDLRDTLPDRRQESTTENRPRPRPRPIPDDAPPPIDFLRQPAQPQPTHTGHPGSPLFALATLACGLAFTAGLVLWLTT